MRVTMSALVRQAAGRSVPESGARLGPGLTGTASVSPGMQSNCEHLTWRCWPMVILAAGRPESPSESSSPKVRSYLVVR